VHDTARLQVEKRRNQLPIRKKHGKLSLPNKLQSNNKQYDMQIIKMEAMRP
jgi:hypothetical protein